MICYICCFDDSIACGCSNNYLKNLYIAQNMVNWELKYDQSRIIHHRIKSYRIALYRIVSYRISVWIDIEIETKANSQTIEIACRNVTKWIFYSIGVSFVTMRARHSLFTHSIHWMSQLFQNWKAAVRRIIQMFVFFSLCVALF